MRINTLVLKYRAVLLYLLFGAMTTFVNIIAYWLMAHYFNFTVMSSTVIAWVLAVSFAYFTNRTWVFESSTRSIRFIAYEVFSFFSCRLASGAIDWGIMFVFVSMLQWNDVIVKAAANVLVIILNYISSKLIVFNKRRA